MKDNSVTIRRRPNADEIRSGPSHSTAKKGIREPKAIPDPYAERDRVLREIGFPTYEQYTASAHWEQIRDRVFRSLGSDCYFCPRPGPHIHHAQYDKATLLGTTIDHLYPVCDTCHRSGHFETDGSMVSLEDATARMRRFSEMKGFGEKMRQRDQLRTRVPSPSPTEANPRPPQDSELKR